MRASIAVFLVCGLSLSVGALGPAGCASGDSNDTSGTGIILGGDGSVTVTGTTDASTNADAPGSGGNDGGATGSTGDAGGSTGPTGPGTFDSGPPATVGGTDSGTPEDDASVGVDAGTDAGSINCGTPSGTYTSTCGECSVANGILSCSCTTSTKGVSADATLNLCSCPVVNEISNSNGVLSCCGIAGGSYQSTCSDCTMLSGALLQCTCVTDNSSVSTTTTLNLCSCSDATSINNTNGELTCN